jgi:methylmalonyl-CoA/ethylmalonyl-CoA epimerase
MITYSTIDAATPAFSSAPLIAIAPKSVAEKSFSEPINRPMGVRAPATITDVVMPCLLQPRSNVSAADLRHRLTNRPVEGYRCVMTTDHVDARPFLASALVMGIDHIGIAVPDLDAAIAWYHDHLGMIVVHEEVNADQGVREAMLEVRGAPRGSAQIQLLAPLDDTSTIAKFIDKRGPGIQQLAYRVSDLDELSERLRAKGVRLLYDAPRRGTANSRINFIHPKDAGGVLVELVQPAEH